MEGVGIKNGKNTVGVAVFDEDFKEDTRIGTYSLGNIRDALSVLSIVHEDTELVVDVLKKENGPLLTLRTSKSTRMAVVVCPIFGGYE